MYTDSHDGSFGALPRRARPRADVGVAPPLRRAWRARGHRLRAHLREPRRRGRRHPAPSPRSDLRLPVPAARARARARRRRASGWLRALRAAARELRDGRRVVYENEGVVAYVPYAARWPYEAHVVMREHRPSLLDCEPTSWSARRGAAEARARLRRAVRAALPLRDGRAPGAHRRPRGAGICTSSSTRRCAPRRSSSTSPAPSRARAPSSPTCSPRTPPPRCARRSPCRMTSRARRWRGPVTRSPVKPHARARVRARAREPDRRAHRLQRRARAALRDRPGRHGAARRSSRADGRAHPRARAGPRRAGRVRARRPPARRGLARVRARHRGRAARAGLRPVGARLGIGGDLPRGRGPVLLGGARGGAASLCSRCGRRCEELDRIDWLARLCARVENEWVGAQHRHARPARLALRRSATRRCASTFRRSEVEPVPLRPAAGGSSRSTPASDTRTRAPPTTSAARSARGRASCWV